MRTLYRMGWTLYPALKDHKLPPNWQNLSVSFGPLTTLFSLLPSIASGNCTPFGNYLVH